MNGIIPSIGRRSEIQRIRADATMTTEQKNREMFMVMNSNNIPDKSASYKLPSVKSDNDMARYSQTLVSNYELPTVYEPTVYEPEETCEHINSYKRLYCPHYPTRRVWMHHHENLLEFYPCRLCYADEAERMVMLDLSIYSNESGCYEGPKLNRKKVKYMKCRACLVSQMAMPSCQNPECYWFQKDHLYYCDICHLWNDDKDKEVFHCDQCKICRVGKRSDYTHCNGCNLCIQKDVEHICVESSAEEGLCPVCLETLHDSQQSVVWSDCNHMFHDVCLASLLESTIRCPVCKKSVCNMDTQWNNMDQVLAKALEHQSVPEEYQDWKWKILCNDCQGMSIVQLNSTGANKCLKCGSYNTSLQGRYDEEEIQALFSGSIGDDD